MKLSKNIRKTAAFFVVFSIFIAVFSSCKANLTASELTAETAEEPTERTMPAGVLTVPYTTLDSLNPFVTKSLLNSSLTSLVFRSLYVTDAGFMPVADLAAASSVQGKTVSVTLTDGIYFSDGTELTATDVIYSFTKAKTSPVYAESLKNIEKCESNSRYELLFTLTDADVNVLSILTFPIAKSSTAENDESLPTGAGRYVYQKGELRTNLVCNLKYNGDIPKIGTIRLYNVTETESLMHLLDIGEIDCFFTDLSEGSAKRTYSSVNEVYLNDLVFIGVNSETFPLNTADMRKAISMACDRRQIVENAFMNHARVTEVPMNTAWTKVIDSKEQIYSESDSDGIASNALLKTLGYGTDGNPITLKLIYADTGSFTRNTASLLAEDLSKVNITLELTKLSTEDYETALKNGEYDLYLGEVKLTKNMDLSCFFAEDGNISYGIAEDAAVRTKYFDYKSGSESLDAFLRAFNESVPFIPLCFRNGQFCYSRTVSGTVEVTEDNIFGTIYNWKI